MRTITVNSSKDEIIRVLKRAGKALGMSLEYFDNNTVELIQPVTFASFGNIIECKVYKSGNRYKVQVESRSKYLLQFIDWGVNSDLESKMIEEIKLRLKRS